ncbi:hypothetical protein Zmor_022591 [Zophobas morio]|uniref:Uncharacterized protein n=1 Tax=Zophobas morio TaxID=2755281 RepID=A0AA38HVJ2_9CUCU|nr:hypothetical protein Zmor_022591 [Zophobas morio]
MPKTSPLRQSEEKHKKFPDNATTDADYGLDPHLMDTELLEEVKDGYVNRVHKTVTEITQIENLTKEQSSCTLGHEEGRTDPSYTLQ